MLGNNPTWLFYLGIKYWKSVCFDIPIKRHSLIYLLSKDMFWYICFGNCSVIPGSKNMVPVSNGVSGRPNGSGDSIWPWFLKIKIRIFELVSWYWKLIY